MLSRVKTCNIIGYQNAGISNIFHHDYNFTCPRLTTYLVGISLLKHQISYLLHPSDVAIFLKMTFKIV